MSYRVNHSDFSFIIVLPGGRKTLSIRLSKLTLILTGLVTLFFIAFISFSSYLAIQSRVNLREYQTAKVELDVQKQKVNEINATIESMEDDIEDLKDKEKKIADLLGMTKKPRRRK